MPTSKSRAVRAYLEKNPVATTQQIVKAVKCEPHIVFAVRNQDKKKRSSLASPRQNSKSAEIRKYLPQHPNAKGVEVTEVVGCDQALVYNVKSLMKKRNGGTVLPTDNGLSTESLQAAKVVEASNGSWASLANHVMQLVHEPGCTEAVELCRSRPNVGLFRCAFRTQRCVVRRARLRCKKFHYEFHYLHYATIRQGQYGTWSGETPTLPRRPQRLFFPAIERFSGSTPSRIRTCDLRIRSPLLYPAELWALLDLSPREEGNGPTLSGPSMSYFVHSPMAWAFPHQQSANVTSCTTHPMLTVPA